MEEKVQRREEIEQEEEEEFNSRMEAERMVFEEKRKREREYTEELAKRNRGLFECGCSLYKKCNTYPKCEGGPPEGCDGGYCTMDGNGIWTHSSNWAWPCRLAVNGGGV